MTGERTDEVKIEKWIKDAAIDIDPAGPCHDNNCPKRQTHRAYQGD